MKRLLCLILTATVMFSLFIMPTSAATNITAASIEQAVLWAENTAADDTHGYSQLNRWGNPDYDCASFVISAFRSVGFKLTSAVHTGNMKQAFLDEGFVWIPNTEIDLSNSKALKRGDILLNTHRHTEIYIGNNMQVGAHEGTIDDYDVNDPGDSTGKEICPVTYNNWSDWEGILRYPAEQHVDVGTDFYAYIINNTTNKLLTNDNRNVSVRAETGESNQVWKFERQTDGSYIIRTCFDSKVLNVSNRGTEPGTNVGVYKNTDSPAKRWFIYGKSGKYRIKPKSVDLALDVPNATSTSEDGTNVCLWTDNGAATQKFTIKKLDPPASTYVDCKAGTSTSLTSIWWNMTLYTNTYNVSIYKDTAQEGEPFLTLSDLTDTYCQVTLPVGNYEVYVESCSSFASTKSMNVASFTVEPGDDLGDTDQDGKISVLDATLIQKHLAQLMTLTDTQLILADTDRDSNVSVMDAAIIQRLLAHIIESI